MIPRFAKVVGFVAGVAAIVWAMRDRFISVAVSHEPQAPAFRTTAHLRDLEEIAGIGPTYASRLRESGYRTQADLVGVEAARVAEVAGVSESRAKAWIEQAQLLP